MPAATITLTVREKDGALEHTCTDISAVDSAVVEPGILTVTKQNLLTT